MKFSTFLPRASREPDKSVDYLMQAKSLANLQKLIISGIVSCR
jgi:hypothetical protein